MDAGGAHPAGRWRTNATEDAFANKRSFRALTDGILNAFLCRGEQNKQVKIQHLERADRNSGWPTVVSGLWRPQ